MEEFLCTDSELLLYAKLKRQEKQLKLKRRWLMGLPLSESEEKQLNRVKFQENKTLPESFLREDDVSYETVKAFVSKGLGVSNYERECHLDQKAVQIWDLPNDLRRLVSMLEDMSNNGLQLFAEILTGGSVEFDKSRWKMKKIIRECLPQVLQNWKNNINPNLAEKICQLLRNSHNFCRNRAKELSPASQSYKASAAKVLDGLEDMSFLTLSAMHRKLRGIQGYEPRLQPSKSGWGRSMLTDRVRKSCIAMLSELGEEDQLQEPLAKALAVGGLWSKLIQGCPFVTEFWHFPPEIEALQNEIGKAIWLLTKKVSFAELKNLQLLLDPNTELSDRSLRTAVRNLLTEYLFECSDMDIVPAYVLECLSILNGTSRSAPYRFFARDEEVEHVLNLSAQLKQILWDILPEYEFDQDFEDAFMEDSEESVCSEDYNDNAFNDDLEAVHQQIVLVDHYDQIYQSETIGDTDPANFELPTSSTELHVSSPVLTPNRRLNKDSSERDVPEESMDSVDSTESASLSSCSKFDSLENTDKTQLHTGSLKNLEPYDHNLLPLKINGSESLSHLPLDATVNGNYVGTGQKPTVDPEKPPDFVSPNFLREGNFMHDKLSTSRNQYLAVQEACDKTSMVAYRLIGCVLHEFAQVEGLDLDCADALYLRGNDRIRKDTRDAKEVHGAIVVQVLEDVLPLFPGRGKETVKQLMGLK